LGRLKVVVVQVDGYSIGAIWCATHGSGFVVYHLGCITFVTAGEHRIAIFFKEIYYADSNTRCTKINYKIVPVTSFTKYVVYRTSGNE